MNLSSTTKLLNGIEVPWLGFGTFKSEPGNETEKAVRWALEIGYRHIDTAAYYENEADVGKAVKASGLDRNEVFITTKVWNADQGYDSTLKAFDKSRRELDMDVIDLYLIHWPVKGKYLESWRALEKLYSDGKVRAIGLSNFLEHHIEDIKKNFDVMPMMNQVEFHPFLLQKNLLGYDKENGIQHEAWSPLGRGKFLDNDVVVGIAEKYGKTAAQVLIRWDLELGVVTIPKSVHRERIQENSEVFDFSLSEEDVKKISALDNETRIGPHPDTM